MNFTDQNMLSFIELFTTPHQISTDVSFLCDQKTEKVPLGLYLLVQLFKILLCSICTGTIFDQMRVHFNTLFNTIACLIEKKVPSLEDLKTYLHMYCDELRLQVEYAESFEGIMLIIKDKDTIIDINCLQTVVDHYNIEGAKDHITAYQQKIDKFCQEIRLNVCCNESFKSANSSLLKCETVEFVLEWAGDNHSLNDIKVLLQKAFQDMANRVQVQYIKEGNSIILTCYAPRHIMDILLIKAEKNLDLLRRFGLIKLTIGYHIAYDVNARNKVRDE